MSIDTPVWVVALLLELHALKVEGRGCYAMGWVLCATQGASKHTRLGAGTTCNADSWNYRDCGTRSMTTESQNQTLRPASSQKYWLSPSMSSPWQ